ncbi:unnamed protein product [Pseudo-nitzschia multistriata]|uniref:Cytochrome b-c1 complex subunit 7 n=1 Tax=Pseudo-nitzschia multistriata TaxID=183589 RepID=A0A448ZPB1_9STRA|nr:unnamed protein product [Pseudo-nitzschia multistriata]
MLRILRVFIENKDINNTKELIEHRNNDSKYHRYSSTTNESTMSALAKTLEPLMKRAARTYQGVLATELNKMGLRAEDLMSRDEPEVNEALELASPDVVEGRYRRLKRASDLAFKQKELQDYAPDMILDPMKKEISADVDKIMKRDLEFDLLNNHKKG